MLVAICGEASAKMSELIARLDKLSLETYKARKPRCEAGLNTQQLSLGSLGLYCPDHRDKRS